MRLPISEPSVTFSSAPIGFSLPGDGAGIGDRLDDFLVAGAAAKVALDAPADFVLAKVAVLAAQMMRLHHEARRAKTALHGTMLDEALLEPVGGRIRGKPFDGHDLAAM